MANEKNVAALCALIEEWESARCSRLERSLMAESLAQLRMPDAGEATGQVPDVPSLWEFLAARGVLVPSAISTEHANAIRRAGFTGGFSAVNPPATNADPTPMINALESIAKGGEGLNVETRGSQTP
jgi:hypothetical protein